MADVEKAVQENGEVPKTAKQLEKEAKKQAKLDKLKQKLEKQSAAVPKKDVEVGGDFVSFVVKKFFVEEGKEEGGEGGCVV